MTWKFFSFTLLQSSGVNGRECIICTCTLKKCGKYDSVGNKLDVYAEKTLAVYSFSESICHYCY